MAASAQLKAAILAAIRGKPGRLGHLRNYKKAIDGAQSVGGASAATKMSSDTITLAASASTDLDLAGAFGTFAKVHSVYVRAADVNVNKVNVGGAPANTFVGAFANASDIIQVSPGDEFLITNDAGWDVTAGTGDLLRLANAAAGSAVTFDIVVTGV